MELPVYRMPRWNNVAYSMYERSKAFVLQAGKVIIAISVILWVFASYGPGDRFKQVEQKYTQPQYAQKLKPDELKRPSTPKSSKTPMPGCWAMLLSLL